MRRRSIMVPNQFIGYSEEAGSGPVADGRVSLSSAQRWPS